MTFVALFASQLPQQKGIFVAIYHLFHITKEPYEADETTLLSLSCAPRSSYEPMRSATKSNGHPDCRTATGAAVSGDDAIYLGQPQRAGQSV